MVSVLSFGPEGWGDELFFGFSNTVGLAVLIFLVGIFIGFCSVAARIFYGKPASYAIKAYTIVFRGLPEVLILYYFFFFFPEVIKTLYELYGYGHTWSVKPFFVAVIALGLVAGAYFSEAFKGALNAIPKEQIESCRAMGMSSGRIFSRIIIPQVIANSIDYINNIWQYLFKDTSLASLIGVIEIMRVAQIANRVEFKPVIIFGAAMVYFLFAYLISQRIFSFAKRYLRKRGEIYQNLEEVSYL